MCDSCHPRDRSNKVAPIAALSRKHFPAGSGESVITPAPLAGFFDPATADPSAAFQAIQEGIERTDIEMEDTARPQLDQLADLIAMARSIFEERQDKELSAPFFQFAIQDPLPDILHSDISVSHATLGLSIAVRLRIWL
jgi:hypothetical protein